jgi:hypothetical protein
VQRRHHLWDDIAGSRGRREHLPRQVRGGGVRNRVVRVHDVELLGAGDLDDLVGQRQQVLRLTK